MYTLKGFTKQPAIKQSPIFPCFLFGLSVERMSISSLSLQQRL